MSVVIPVRNDHSGLRRVLSGLALQTLPPDEVLIVDSGDPSTCETMRSPIPRVISIPPAFPGAARNRGAAEVRNPWVAFVDSGTKPMPGWLEAFHEAAAANPEADVLYGSYQPAMEDDWDWAAALIYLAPPAEPSGGRFPTAASFCLKREAWDRVGGMREDLRSGEDLLFFEEVAANGLRTVAAPKARVLWDLPRGVGGHFARLRRYSQATWGTPLARKWQIPVLRMYVLGLGVLVGALLVEPSLLFLILLLGAVRFVKRVAERRQDYRGPLTIPRMLKLPALMFVVDAASIAGVWDAVFRAGLSQGGGLGDVQ